MKVISLLLSFILFLALALPFSAFAENKVGSNDSGIPETNGDYQDPHNKNIRVRVFVHKVKNHDAQALLTCDDPGSTASVGWAGWKLPAGSWTYRLNPSSVPSSVGGANLSTIAAAGFSAWQGAQNKVTFTAGPTTTKVRSSYDGQNIIAWGRTSGSALGVTYVRYYTSTRLVVDVDTIMNNKFAWSWNGGSSTTCGNPNTYDAQNILVHEQGHWLGLDDFYTAGFVNNTMYGYGSKGETKKISLTSGDIFGVAAIYH